MCYENSSRNIFGEVGEFRVRAEMELVSEELVVPSYDTLTLEL